MVPVSITDKAEERGIKAPLAGGVTFVQGFGSALNPILTGGFLRYVASFAVDKATYEQIRTLILGLINRSQKIVLAAESTNVFQLDIDFFQWDH